MKARTNTCTRNLCTRPEKYVHNKKFLLRFFSLSFTEGGAPMKIPFTIDENFGRYRPAAKRFNMTLNRKNLARLDAMACAMDIDAITLTRAAVKWMLASFEADPDRFLAEAARIKAPEQPSVMPSVLWHSLRITRIRVILMKISLKTPLTKNRGIKYGRFCFTRRAHIRRPERLP